MASGHVSDWPKDVSGKVKGQLPEKNPSFVLHGSSAHVALITATVLLGKLLGSPQGLKGYSTTMFSGDSETLNIQTFNSSEIYQIEIYPPLF